MTKVEEIAEAGFTAAWLPPCSQSVDKHGNNIVHS